MTTALATYESTYVAKKALFSFLGSTFRIFDTKGEQVFYVKQKAFKLKEEINVFRTDAQQDKRLSIRAGTIGDFSGSYDILDGANGQRLGGGKRQGLKSLFKDEWLILDRDGTEAGKVVETGGFLIFLRKFIKLIPQKYEVSWKGAQVGTIQQRFNPFQLAYDCDFSAGKGTLDPRLGVGMVVLLLAIEGGKD
jgi:uncharacterized protein YxjI